LVQADGLTLELDAGVQVCHLASNRSMRSG
jgi:hypothetical protein